MAANFFFSQIESNKVMNIYIYIYIYIYTDEGAEAMAKAMAKLALMKRFKQKTS